MHEIDQCIYYIPTNFCPVYTKIIKIHVRIFAEMMYCMMFNAHTRFIDILRLLPITISTLIPCLSSISATIENVCSKIYITVKHEWKQNPIELDMINNKTTTKYINIPRSNLSACLYNFTKWTHNW